MQTAERIDYITVEEYLAAEETSDVRHEYLGGLVYAMAGETRSHNQISQNVAFALRQHLKGGPCKLYISDIRVNFRLKDDEYFYYPDLVVTCDPRDTHPRFIRYPKLIIEVLSPGTERVDRREKFFAYTTVESLEEYMLISQEEKEATVFRRANNWKSEKISGPDVAFASLPFTLPIAAIYEGI
jgi:Uma2 family endonuclease